MWSPCFRNRRDDKSGRRFLFLIAFLNFNQFLEEYIVCLQCAAILRIKTSVCLFSRRYCIQHLWRPHHLPAGMSDPICLDQAPVEGPTLVLRGAAGGLKHVHAAFQAICALALSWFIPSPAPCFRYPPYRGILSQAWQW